MLAQAFRPIRCLGSRLLVSPIGSKSTIDSDQQITFPADADFLHIESSSVLDTELEVSCGSGSTISVADVAVSSTTPKPLRGLITRLLSAHVDATNKVQSHVVAPGSAVSSPHLELLPATRSVGVGGEISGPSHAAAPLIPAPWQMHSPFNSHGSNAPWIDMRMHQAPEATYYKPDVAATPAELGASNVPANGFVLLAPVLMPVFGPFWGMPSVASTQHMPEMVSGEVPCRPTAESGQAVATTPHEEAVDGVRRHRRSRRGGAAMRRKLASATSVDDVSQMEKAVREIEDACQVASSSNETPETSSNPEADDTSPSSLASLKTDATAVQLEGQQPLCADEVASDVAASPPSSIERSTSGSSDSVENNIDPYLLELEDADEERRLHALEWVTNSFWPLALTKRGCRIVQKAIDVGTPTYQQQLLEHMHGRVREALNSPHTNYVLQKFIETMPPERMQFVVNELQGDSLRIAKHRFGCRILQRLIEHCSPQQTEPLIEEILSDTASLCRHQYGNFIIQHILQHGSPEQRSAIARVVHADIIRLAKHRIASHVVSCAMVHCPSDDVQMLTQAVLHDAGQLADLSRREYGSFVVREVNRAAKMLRV